MEKLFLGDIYGHHHYVEIDKTYITSDEELEVIKNLLHKYFRDSNDAWLEKNYKDKLNEDFDKFTGKKDWNGLLEKLTIIK